MIMRTNDHGLIAWQDGQPYSTQFQDVYFNSDDGLLETDYVFLQANRLAERWLNYPNKTFSIAETGFGTGLNFLSAAKLWLSIAPEQANLHFISAEKYPLSLLDMSKASLCWPELKPLSAALLANYQELVSQPSELSLFAGRVRLSLFIGDASATYAALCAQPENAKVDAWFLDGFAPAKNPDMWQDRLFQHMASLSHTATTFATFTSASAVRRGLMAAGFAVNKQAGFAKKREMLYGQFIGLKHAA